MSSTTNKPVCYLVSVGASITINVSSGICVYSEPKDREKLKENTKLIGLYDKVKVNHIAKIQKVVEGYPSDGEDKKRITEYLNICKAMDITIEHHLKSTTGKADGLRYYLTDKFYETSFRKNGEPQRSITKMYINLYDYMENPCDKSVEEIAKILDGESWG